MNPRVLLGAAVGRTTVGFVVLWAASSKVTMMHLGTRGQRFGVEAFAAQVRDAGVIPGSLASLAAWATLCAEVGVGIWLLSHRRPRMSAFAGVTLLSAFSIYLVLVATQSQSTCPCFGSVTSARSPWPFARNGLLVCALLPSFSHGRSSNPPPDISQLSTAG